MEKFKVGDIVRPNKKADSLYRITNRAHMKEGVVIEVSPHGALKVRITKWVKNADSIDTYWVLNPACFDLVRRGGVQTELHITGDGKTVHAVLKENGKVVKRAKADCDPRDEYNFETGARLATDRVFGKEAEKKEPTYKFNIGDVVTVVSPRRYSFAWSNAFIPLFGEKCLRRFARRGYPPEDCPYVVRQKAEWEDPFGKKVKMYVIEELHFPGLYGGAYHIVDEKGLVKQY